MKWMCREVVRSMVTARPGTARGFVRCALCGAGTAASGPRADGRAGGPAGTWPCLSVRGPAPGGPRWLAHGSLGSDPDGLWRATRASGDARTRGTLASDARCPRLRRGVPGRTGDPGHAARTRLRLSVGRAGLLAATSLPEHRGRAAPGGALSAGRVGGPLGRP